MSRTTPVDTVVTRLPGAGDCVIVARTTTGRAVPILSLVIGDLTAIVASLLITRMVVAIDADTLPWLLAGYIGFGLSLHLIGLYPGRGLFGAERVHLRAVAALLAFAPPAVSSASWLGIGASALLSCTVAGLCLFFLSAFFETIVIELLLSRNLWRVNAELVGESGDVAKVRRKLELFPELGFRLTNPEAMPGTDVLNNPGIRTKAAEAGGKYFMNASAPLPAVISVERFAAIFGGGVGRILHHPVKRCLDMAGSGVLIILLSPIMVAAALLIMIHDGRPIFFRQTRGGKDGKMIAVWKFRSMYRDAPDRLEGVLAADPATRAEWNRFFKLRKDPRILPVVGNIIRKTSVDELPQLWNVLKGEMSLVGPRPFPDNHLSVFSQEFRCIRQSVLPGISGLWQITLRSDGDVEMQEWLDTAYVRGWSIWLDLYILFKTPVVLLSSRGAR